MEASLDNFLLFEPSVGYKWKNDVMISDDDVISYIYATWIALSIEQLVQTALFTLPILNKMICMILRLKIQKKMLKFFLAPLGNISKTAFDSSWRPSWNF